MIDRREILGAAEISSVGPQITEKDYVLGWVLWGIFGNEKLAGNWVFKGGTCLKKCFFETYRFSEDLDFTITDPSHRKGTSRERTAPLLQLRPPRCNRRRRRSSAYSNDRVRSL